MDAETFQYHREGRNKATLLAVALVWTGLLAAYTLVDAAIWLMALIGVFTLPALWDLYKNPASGLTFNPKAITWFTGTRHASVDWHEIDHVRLDTRLDFSVRASAVLQSGRKIRVPYECTPPDAILEAALNARGVRTERHHFSLIG